MDPVRIAGWTAAGLSLHAAVNAALLRRPPREPAPVGELVSVLVPARDEEGRIGACLAAVLASTGVSLEVLVLDDGSRDGTAAVVEGWARRDGRVRLLGGAPLPVGWLGKPHACAQLATAARGGVLVFLDADVVVAPQGIAAAVALLRGAAGAGRTDPEGGAARGRAGRSWWHPANVRRRGAPAGGPQFDLVSPYPRVLADGPGPRLVQPLLQWLWLTFVPLRLAEALRVVSMAVAGGQFMVADAAAYRAAGGHAAVRGAVLEDVELARVLRRRGARVALADGSGLAACRMYRDWPEVRDGYSKSLWAALPSPAGALAVLAFLVSCYVLPPVALAAAVARRRPHAAVTALAATAAGVAGRVVAAARTGGRPADALAHPLSVLALAWLTARSYREHRAGRLRWKGRTLP